MLDHVFWVAYLKHNQSNYVLLSFVFVQNWQPKIVDLRMLICLFCIN